VRLPIPPRPQWVVGFRHPERHPRFRRNRLIDVVLDALTSLLDPTWLPVLVAYGLLGGAYLFIVPLGLFLWMNRRWHHMGKLERLGIYGLVFLFFPGMILFAPFLNFRLQGQGEV
jgi:NAD(P)H-quinone oxidoreductase subunit L